MYICIFTHKCVMSHTCRSSGSNRSSHHNPRRSRRSTQQGMHSSHTLPHSCKTLALLQCSLALDRGIETRDVITRILERTEAI